MGESEDRQPLSQKQMERTPRPMIQNKCYWKNKRIKQPILSAEFESKYDMFFKKSICVFNYKNICNNFVKPLLGKF